MSKDIAKMLKQVQKLQSQVMQAQDELAKKTFEGTSGGTMVKVVLTGAGDVQQVSLNPEVVDPADVEMLEDLIVAAFKNAQENLKQASNASLGSLPGMDLGKLGLPL
jgi:DNA-binding YbaB/EbfC family protein